jgi:ABC-2 type transport system permease protein
MTDTTLPATRVMDHNPISARPAGVWRDLLSVAGRAVREVLREGGQLAIGLIVPLFFFIVNVGALSDVSSFTGVDNYLAFQLPVAIVHERLL